MHLYICLDSKLEAIWSKKVYLLVNRITKKQPILSFTCLDSPFPHGSISTPVCVLILAFVLLAFALLAFVVFL